MPVGVSQCTTETNAASDRRSERGPDLRGLHRGVVRHPHLHDIRGMAPG